MGKGGLMEVDVDAAGLLAALDRLGEAAERHVKAVAFAAANRVANEAGRRVARRTGATAAGITVEEMRSGAGYVVFVKTDPGNLDFWLEFGTRHMKAQPFLLAAALLEQGTFRRDLAEALQDAIDESGLGG